MATIGKNSDTNIPDMPKRSHKMLSLVERNVCKGKNIIYKGFGIIHCFRHLLTGALGTTEELGT